MASDSSSGFRPGALHISLRTLKTQPRGWKKRTNEQTRTWVSSKRKRRGFVTLLCSSPYICRLSRACILRETSTKPLEILTHLLTVFSALLPSSHCLLQPTVSFSEQLSQADCSVLPSFINCLSLSSLGPSLPQSFGRSRAQTLCVGFVPKQKRMLPIVSHWLKYLDESWRPKETCCRLDLQRVIQ